MNRRGSEKTVDLVLLMKLLIHRLPWLLLAAIICGALALSYCTFIAKPMYTSSTTLYVYSDGTSDRNESMYVTYSELYAAQYLAEPYISVLQSDRMMQSILNRLKLDMTIPQLRSAIQIETNKNSLVLTITAKHRDARTAQRILQALVDEAPDEIERVIRAGGISVINTATLPDKPSSPVPFRDTVLAAFAGAFFLAIIFAIVEVSSTVIRNEDELQKMLSVPVLGTIPKIENNTKEMRA